VLTRDSDNIFPKQVSGTACLVDSTLTCRQQFASLPVPAGRPDHLVAHISVVVLLDVLKGYGNHENVLSIALCIRMIL